MNSALRRHVSRDRAIKRALSVAAGLIVLATYLYVVPFILLFAGSSQP